MDKNRNTKIIIIVALCVAIAGLSIGFAAFSNILTISTRANVSPSDDTFDVNFSSDDLVSETNPVVATTSSAAVVATNATIDNSTDPLITNLSATFTAPGQNAKYTFYAMNEGEYAAFLNSIEYTNVTGEATAKKCTPGEGTNAALVEAACAGIVVKVKVGSDAEISASSTSISDHTLAIDASEQIDVTIEYLATGARADGDFSVEFGDIILTYSAVD